MKVLLVAAAVLIGACAHKVPPAVTAPPDTKVVIPPVMTTPPDTNLAGTPDASPPHPPPGRRVVTVLQVRIDATGRVTEASVVEGAGAPYDEYAVAKMRDAKFKPARTADDRPVESVIRWRFIFETEK